MKNAGWDGVGEFRIVLKTGSELPDRVCGYGNGDGVRRV